MLRPLPPKGKNFLAQVIHSGGTAPLPPPSRGCGGGGVKHLLAGIVWQEVRIVAHPGVAGAVTSGLARAGGKGWHEESTDPAEPGKRLDGHHLRNQIGDMRLVQDTNVLVSALRSGAGASRILLRKLLQREHCPLLGDKLWLEYQDLAGRDDVWEGCALNREDRRKAVDDFGAVCQWVAVWRVWRPNLPDEGDNHLMELAIYGRADALVTFNVRDFSHALFAPPGLEIGTPAEFLQAHP